MARFGRGRDEPPEDDSSLLGWGRGDGPGDDDSETVRKLRARVAELEERDDPHTAHLMQELHRKELAAATEEVEAAHARVAELEEIFARVHERVRGYGFEAPADVTHEVAVLLLLQGRAHLAYNEKRIAELTSERDQLLETLTRGTEK